MSAGYSGTPLHKKLGLKPGMLIYTSGTPGPYEAFFTDFPEVLAPADPAKLENIDFIHVFCTRHDHLQDVIPDLISALKKSGMMWVSWPKGSSSIRTDINRESVRTFMHSQGLVDVKVCAVDINWSGLKFVYRLKDR